MSKPITIEGVRAAAGGSGPLLETRISMQARHALDVHDLIGVLRDFNRSEYDYLRTLGRNDHRALGLIRLLIRQLKELLGYPDNVHALAERYGLELNFYGVTVESVIEQLRLRLYGLFRVTTDGFLDELQQAAMIVEALITNLSQYTHS